MSKADDRSLCAMSSEKRSGRMGPQPAAGVRTPAPRPGLPGCPPQWAFGLRKSYKRMRIKTTLVSGERGLRDPAWLQHRSLLQSIPGHERISHPLGSHGGCSGAVVAQNWFNGKLKHSLLGMRSCCIRRGCWVMGRHLKQGRVRQQVTLTRAPCTLSPELPASSASRLAGSMPRSACPSHRLSAPPSANQGCSLHLRSQDLVFPTGFCSLAI